MAGKVNHGRSGAAARRAWIVIGIVLLCALGVWISVHFIVPERSKDIWVESAKSALQLAVLATTGGVVAAVLGAPLLHPLGAGRGDVALVDVDGRECLGIVLGELVAGPAASGLLMVPRAAIQAAWAV